MLLFCKIQHYPLEIIPLFVNFTQFRKEFTPFCETFIPRFMVLFLFCEFYIFGRFLKFVNKILHFLLIYPHWRILHNLEGFLYLFITHYTSKLIIATLFENL